MKYKHHISKDETCEVCGKTKETLVIEGLGYDGFSDLAFCLDCIQEMKQLLERRKHQ